jgi:hypothetical protein
MARSQLQRFLSDEIPTKEAENVLVDAGLEAFRRGWTYMDASFQLGQRAEELGLPAIRVEEILRESFDFQTRKERFAEQVDGVVYEGNSVASEAGGVISSTSFINKNQISNYFNIESAEIPWPDPAWRSDLVRLVSQVFEKGESYTLQLGETGKPYAQKVDEILLHGDKIIPQVKALEGRIPKIRVNPKGDRDHLPSAFRHLLMEVRGIELGRQLAFFKMFNLPCSALVNVGGKSIQAWVHLDAANKEEYEERATFLARILKDIGFDIYTWDSSPFAPAVLPGVVENGKQCYLVGLNEGAGSWEEWRAWADAYLDGDPLVEDSNTYDEVPLLGLELIEGLIRQPHVAVLSGKRALGKSMLLMDMSVSVSAGTPFLESSTEQAYVLYVNLEQDTSSILRRFFDVKKHKNLEGKEVELDFLHLLGSEKPVLEFFDFLVKRIEAVRKWEQKRYSLVVIDGLSRIPGWDRVDSSKDGHLFSVASGIDRLILRTGVAVVLSLTDKETEQLPFNPDLNLYMSGIEDKPNKVILDALGRHISEERSWVLKRDWPLFVKE